MLNSDTLLSGCLASVAGAVIQATGRTDLEDGLCAGGQLKAWNGLQRVRTGPRPPRGKTQFESCRGPRSCRTSSPKNGSPHWVRFPAAAVLGLTTGVGKQDVVGIGREAKFQALRAGIPTQDPFGGPSNNNNNNNYCLALSKTPKISKNMVTSYVCRWSPTEFKFCLPFLKDEWSKQGALSKQHDVVFS